MHPHSLPKGEGSRVGGGGVVEGGGSDTVLLYWPINHGEDRGS